jgi:hypothetical protein
MKMKPIYSMKPEERTAHLKEWVGSTVNVIYGRHFQRDVLGRVLGVAAPLGISISDQLVIQSNHGGQLFVISSASIVSIED